MANSAFWDFADDTRQALLWRPIVALEEASLDLDLELAEHAWNLFDVQVDPELEFVLPGQLLQTRSITRENRPVVESWAKIRDLGQAWIVPVALAFPLPDQMANAAEGVTRFRAATFPPPGVLGQFGVVFSNRQRWTYPLGWLGPKAIDLQTHLAALLQHITEQDYLKESARFQQAQALAHQLAGCYHAYHLSTLIQASRASDDYAQPSPSTSLIAPAIAIPVLPGELPRSQKPSLSPRGTFLIPSPQPVHYVLEAIYAAQEAGQWKEQAGIPTYEVQRAGRTIIQVRPDATVDEPDEQTTRFLWQVVRALSDTDAVVFLALLAFLWATPPDEHGGQWVYVQDLLELRAIRPKLHRIDDGNARPAGFHQEDKDRVSAAVDHLNRVWIQLLKRGVIDAPINKLILIDSLLLKRSTMLSRYVETRDLSPATREGRPHAYHIALGPWLAPFLKRAHPPVAHLHPGALHYRLHDKFWEERLLSYICLHAWMSRGHVLRCRIRTLFDTLKLPADPQRPWDARRRFEQAMEQLKTDHYITDWKSEQEHLLPTKDWFERWQDTHIDVLLLSPSYNHQRDPQAPDQAAPD
jgi:hypothetical protein